MAPRSKTLAEVRARLDLLADLRLAGPLSDDQRAEYKDLLALEATLLAASRSERSRDGDAPTVDDAHL